MFSNKIDLFKKCLKKLNFFPRSNQATISLKVGVNVKGIGDTAGSGAGTNGHSDVSFFTPSSSPGVLDDEIAVVIVALAVVSDGQNTVVQTLSAARVRGVNSAPIKLEVASDFNGD